MRVVIVGAGNVGRSIARELIGNGHDVLIIDRDPRAVKSDTVPEAEWLLADACELESLTEAELNSCDVSVAATGDDKVNLVHSLLAKTEFGVPRTVARVNHPDNEWMFDEEWGVDIAVSTPRIMSALVEEAVSVGDVVRILTFRQGLTNLVELTLPDTSSACERLVSDLTLPETAVLVAIIRDGRAQPPASSTTLRAGDELFFLIHENHERELLTTFGTQPESAI